MGARFLVWFGVLFILGSGIGAIIDGSAPAGVAQMALAVTILVIARWHRRRRAALVYQRQQLPSNFYKGRRRRG